MANLTREQILARSSGIVEVELHDGATVSIRGMSRREGALMKKFGEDHPEDVLGQEALALHIALVEPELSQAEALEWLSQPGTMDDAQRVIVAIQAANGQGDGQAKEYLKSVPRRRRAPR